MIIRYCTYYPDNNLPLELNQKNIKERKNEKNGEGGKKSSYYMGFGEMISTICSQQF